MDLDAYATVVELLSQAHAYGESIHTKMEMWLGISSGLIIMAYFAPDRLKPNVTALVVLLYVGLSIFFVSNILEDVGFGDAAVADAQHLAQVYELRSEVLDRRVNDARSGRGLTSIGIVVMTGFFAGTIGFVILTAWQIWRRQKHP